MTYFLHRNLKPLIVLVSLLNMILISGASPLKPGIPIHTTTLASALSLLLLVPQSHSNLIHPLKGDNEVTLSAVPRTWLVFIGPHTRWENLIQMCLESFLPKNSGSPNIIIPICFISEEIMFKETKQFLIGEK